MERIILAGATGLIGGLVAARLPGVTAIGRRAADGIAHQLIARPEEWPALIADAKPTIAISTLGTTIRRAGSQEAFATIDHDLVIAFARAAREAGAQRFIMVSSVGANAMAGNFYLKTKGRAEQGVRALGFERVDIMRPGLLVADRPGDARPVERLMILLSPLTNTLTPARFDHYRAVDASAVGDAIVALAGADQSGVFVHHNREILALAADRA
jgi:uncharacterized protein YbjT (DUF2867 family)